MAGRILRRCCYSSIPQVMKIGNGDKILIKNQITISRRWKFGFPKLTPQQVNNILKTQENSVTIENPGGAVTSFDTNQLPSNNPIEDRRTEARCVLTTGLLFGVFDGHAGSACADGLSHRLFYYLAASFLPRDLLTEYASQLLNPVKPELIKMYNKEVTVPTELATLYYKHFVRFVEELLADKKNEFIMEAALVRAFEYLDKQMSEEARMEELASLHSDLLSVAASGSVACVAHIDGPHLHVANVGDCRAVLGTLDENNLWVPKSLSNEHNAENVDEVNRIISEHPSSEAENVLRHERLLGQLAPLRAFGDCRYKWNMSDLKKYLVPIFGNQSIPPNYLTPPYLNAIPEVMYHRLMPRDRFLVLASDGLWDQLSAHKVVNLVGEYMSGRQTLDVLQLPNKNMKLREIKEILDQRREGVKHKPVDANAATHLIRNALGGTEFGVEHSMLSQMLCVPDDVVRLIRDDITIIVIFFNNEYLRHCPA